MDWNKKYGMLLASQGCLSKVPWARWLKTTTMCFLLILRVVGQSQGVSGAMLPLKASEKDCSLPLCSFWWLPAVLGVPWHIGATSPNLYSVVTWSSQSMSVSVSVSSYGLPIRMLAIGIRVHPNPGCPHPNWLHLRRLYFQTKSHSEDVGRPETL